MTEGEVLAFARTVRSIWTVHMLLLFSDARDRQWTALEIVRELRASSGVVEEGLRTLVSGGLVAEQDAAFVFRPASSFLEEAVTALAALYRERPLAVTNALYSPTSAVQSFADAFRFRKDEA